MRIDISLKHLDKSSILEEVIEKDIKKIERRLKIFKTDDAIHLSLHLEKNPHRDEYFCWINMYLPSKVLKAQSRKNDVYLVINDAFDALLKQLDKLKYRLERHLRKK